VHIGYRNCKGLNAAGTVALRGLECTVAVSQEDTDNAAPTVIDAHTGVHYKDVRVAIAVYVRYRYRKSGASTGIVRLRRPEGAIAVRQKNGTRPPVSLVLVTGVANETLARHDDVGLAIAIHIRHC